MIRKIRVVPKNYEPLEMGGVMDAVMEGMTPAEVFYALYRRYGKPQGMSYLLRYKTTAFLLTFSERLDVVVYVSPAVMREARQKKVKVMNVLAREVNAKGCVFCPGGDVPDYLYFAVKVRNERLVGKYGGDKERMYDDFKRAAGDAWVLRADEKDFLPDIETVVREFFQILKGGCHE